MGQLDVTVAGRTHRLACEDGQEDRLRALAAQVDAEARSLQAQLGAVGEPRLLLMAALLFADRAGEREAALREAEAALEAARSETPEASAAQAPAERAPPPADGAAQPGLFDGAAGQAALGAALERLERIVAEREG